jgi:uncharacterized integral membrane protein (TIGR00698 family)
MQTTQPSPVMTLIYRLLQVKPGALLCIVIGLAASFVSKVHGGPTLLYALLLGIAFHFLCTDEKIKPGIEFCAVTLLRLGVALLGARITLVQIAALGWETAITVVLCVSLTLFFGIWFARKLGMSTAQGVLSGGSTAICGASAALAISAVLPRSREQDNFTLLVIFTVTSLSTIAMVLYPLLAQALHLSPAQAGLFLGGSIHDVAQVIGAGYVMSSTVGENATLVKLFRISLLALVVIVVSTAFRAQRLHQENQQNQKLAFIPWFLWVFCAFVVINSLMHIPAVVSSSFNEISKSCLLLAISALGVKTSLQTLFQTGWRPFILLLSETIWLGTLLLLAIFLF